MYEQFYGFGTRPFRLTPDPHFFFESASHRKALSYLGYGLGQSEGIIVVTGEAGAGKTLLAAHLTARVDPAALCVAQVLTPAPGGEAILAAAAGSFGLDVAGLDRAGAFAAIERHLQDEARAGRRGLLVVDEGQTLDLPALEALRMLSNLRLGAHPLLQVLLLGQPEFRRTLVQHPELEQLRQRVIASHHLEALGEGEVEYYVRHRLSLVGWDARPALAAGMPEALHRHSGGNPRRINQIMNRLLLLAALEASEVLLPAMLDAVVAEMAADEARGVPMPAPAPETGVPATAELAAALAPIEARLAEQEQSLRHVLTMLIEWLEDDPAARAA